MNSLQAIFYFIAALLFASFFSCNDDFDNYSTDKSLRLSFSTDTVTFDTILSTVGTPTKRFMVYNNNDKRLLISSVSLKNGDQSGFRINIDGQNGSTIKNVEIGAHDSVYVFVETTLKPNGKNDPVQVTDQVVFITNEVEQSVVVEAFGQDAVIWKGETIESSMTLSDEKPYLIYDSLVIKEGVELMIPEGVTFYMHNNASIIVRGNIKAKGAIDKKIVFRGDRTDYLIDIPYDRIPKQWGGIYFASNSYDNELEYVDIKNGTFGLYCELSDPGRSKMKIKNAVITNASGNLVMALNCNIEAENCEFSNSGRELLYLSGGKYSFTHCTAANYMAWSDFKSKGQTLLLSNYMTDTLGKVTQLMPIQADFFNSIIYGNQYESSYIKVVPVNATDHPGVALTYKFQNCLLSSSGENDGKDVINCIFNEDPKFKITDPKKVVYNFRLDSISPARNVADPAIANKVPFDMDGISRISDEGPDMGSYEWIPAQ